MPPGAGYPFKFSEVVDIRTDIRVLLAIYLDIHKDNPCGCPCRIISATDSSTHRDITAASSVVDITILYEEIPGMM